MDIKQDFKVYCSTNFKELNKSLIEDAFAEEGELILEGIASTTSVDEDGDYMTKECLEDMKRQAIGLSVLKSHGRTLDDILGRVVGIPASNDDEFRIKFKVLPKHKYYLLEFLDNDINLALSIGAKALDYEPDEDSDGYGWKVNKAKLYEISLVPLPANWDSFGSVKISKELGEDGIVAKCFNGACKLLVKEYSESLNKEVEDAQSKEDEKYLTEKEAVNLINEASLGIYERLYSEVLDEAKKMIEKYHLDNNHGSNENQSNESENSNDNKIDDNSSKKKEDEEKNKSMKEEINKEMETDETPDVQKNLGEVDGTSNGDEGVEMKEEINKELETNEPTVDVNVSVDNVSNEDVLKSIGELKSFMQKSLDETIEKRVSEKVEEMKKGLRKEVEDELFKELTTERKPQETEQPKVEEPEEKEEEQEVNKAMNAHDIAKMLCG